MVRGREAWPPVIAVVEIRVMDEDWSAGAVAATPILRLRTTAVVDTAPAVVIAYHCCLRSRWSFRRRHGPPPCRRPLPSHSPLVLSSRHDAQRVRRLSLLAQSLLDGAGQD